MLVSTTFLLALGASALASALKVLIAGPWSWREFFAWTAYTAIVLFVSRTNSTIRIG